MRYGPSGTSILTTVSYLRNAHSRKAYISAIDVYSTWQRSRLISFPSNDFCLPPNSRFTSDASRLHGLRLDNHRDSQNTPIAITQTTTGLFKDTGIVIDIRNYCKIWIAGSFRSAIFHTSQDFRYIRSSSYILVFGHCCIMISVS